MENKTTMKLHFTFQISSMFFVIMQILHLITLLTMTMAAKKNESRFLLVKSFLN